MSQDSIWTPSAKDVDRIIELIHARTPHGGSFEDGAAVLEREAWQLFKETTSSEQFEAVEQTAKRIREGNVVHLRAETRSLEEAAIQALESGISIVPVTSDGRKRPDLASWKDYQERRASPDELRRWILQNPAMGLGVIGGKVSGGLVVIDIDRSDLWEPFLRRAEEWGCGDLVGRVQAGYWETSPCGHHLAFRSPLCATTTLAQAPGEKKGQRKTLIETKGEGGMVTVAPSCGTVHPSGRPYRLHLGGFDSIETISEDEAEQLFALARSFDRMPIRPSTPARETTRRSGASIGDRPGDDFNERATWGDVFDGTDWTLSHEAGGQAYWTRPGKAKGVSASTDRHPGYLVVWSTSTDFEIERGYDKFGAFAILHHGGDLAAAAKDLGERGYGKQRESRERIEEPRYLQDDEPLPPVDDDHGPERDPSNGVSANPGRSGDEKFDAGTLEGSRTSMMRSASDLIALGLRPESDYILKGLINRQDIGYVHGRHSSGKTAWVMKLCRAVVLGESFMGMRTRKSGGLTFHCFAEGAAKLPRRLMALGPDDPIASGRMFFRPRTLDLTKSESASILIAEIASVANELGVDPALVVIDTSHAHLGGGFENDGTDTSLLFSACRGIRDSFPSIAIIVITHEPDTKSKVRGHLSQEDDADFLISLSIDEASGLGLWKTRKQRDEGLARGGYRLQVIDLGETDEDGDSIRSVTVVEADGGEAQAANAPAVVKGSGAERRRWGDLMDVIDAVARAIDDGADVEVSRNAQAESGYLEWLHEQGRESIDAESRRPLKVRGTSRDRLRDLLRVRETAKDANKTAPGRKPDTIRKAATRMMGKAKDAKLLWEFDGVVWISQEHRDD